ncbi:MULTISPECIES: DNA adenine methylase [unclassified Campylobacter]|uniref:DNA adenine methylase n=1 Tax=unclassified Campylobacter TaxID=2593542 RepID=UPI001DDE251E|nr:DNA adenine methylase [Campylobacter sp. RM9331]MBZ8005186.1 DNA adenine methylase [Campylobacter sp. RM9332]
MQKILKLKAPFAWVGGKYKLADTIVPFIDKAKHKIYVEPFCGALSVFYAKNPSKIEVINDVNDDLVNLHFIIKTRPQSLKNELERLLISRKLHELIRDKKATARNDIERAAFTFYMIKCSFGSKINKSGGGVTFACGKHRSPANIVRDFTVYSRRLRNVCIENKDALELIEYYNDKDTLFYLDPPYVSNRKLYDNIAGFSHEKLQTLLKHTKAKFVLSYNNCDEILALYKDFNIHFTSVKQCFRAKYQSDRAELIITNF